MHIILKAPLKKNSEIEICEAPADCEALSCRLFSLCLNLAVTPTFSVSLQDGEKVAETSPEESKPEESGEQEAEEEEEPEAELTEEEENIKGNLMGEEALSLETVEKIASDWWNKEPFK